MFAYLLNRWTITRRFERADVGYVYRRRPDLPGFVVTEQERQDLLRKFRRRYWKFWLRTLAGLLAGVAVIAIVAAVFGFGDSFLKSASYVFVFVLLALFAWEQRKWSLLPERHFEECPQIGPEVPSSGWLDRFHDMMRNRSWMSHTALILSNGVFAWLFSLNLSEAGFGQWLLFVAFISAVVVSLYGVVHKARS